MSDTAICVENLGKKYIIDRQRDNQKYTALRDVIANSAKGFTKRLNPFKTHSAPLSSSQEEFWALRDVSFDIKQGDRVGIIGRNGAGKSTLLKILSRITEPTTGRIAIGGRVASLLEVGTGFHPELTGRENIFLNGAILGMGKLEINRKFDEIVEFAEVEKFLDTPVKRYSSGMYVRLAFAVAAHLEPEILIVDEVLAVGDAQFQAKCLGKMKEVGQGEGRTVLFVSHNMAAISNLCNSSIFLQNGKVEFQGTAELGVRKYLEFNNQIGKEQRHNLDVFRPSWANPYISSARVLNSSYEEQNTFAMGDSICIEMAFKNEEIAPIKNPVMGIIIKHTVLGVVSGVNTRMTGTELRSMDNGIVTMRCLLERTYFLQGNYTVDVWLGSANQDIDTLTEYLQFTVEATDIYGSGNPPFAALGTMFLEPKWEILSV
jgi:lipopolysaccharide transport system ATP-binding protein